MSLNLQPLTQILTEVFVVVCWVICKKGHGQVLLHISQVLILLRDLLQSLCSLPNNRLIASYKMSSQYNAI